MTIPKWLTPGMILQAATFLALAGAGYQELKGSLVQFRADLEKQGKEIEKIKAEYLPREIFTGEMAHTRETLADIKTSVIETQRLIRQFK